MYSSCVSFSTGTPARSAVQRSPCSSWPCVHSTGLPGPFPFPRGIPIQDSTTGVTAEINRSRSYLEKCLQSL